MSNELDRAERGRFVKGHGVRGGRPAGPSKAELITRHLSPHLTEVLDKVAELAKLGDGKSQALFLSYIAPVAARDSERVNLPGLATAQTLEEKAQVVIAAVGSGEISAEAGERLLRLIQTYSQAVKQDEIEARLQAIEQGRTLVQPDENVIDVDVEPMRPEDLA